MSSIRPNDAQVIELMNAADEGPVVMVNLLKFKGNGGVDEYERYGKSVVGIIENLGGKLLWQGRADQILIGDPDETWDAVALVQYPSRKSFIEMTATREYNAIHEHRASGLERTVVIACTPRLGAF